ncbi:aspartyl-phosphate phosphatase Spo0E family protein [Oceanobacillus halotolerans]|uniref:aspartyl-phosphate phosphatase Spo0E family protein n=1 Tax=Oceanobacillus halotolerans TaxID=2663380 RepID=UPI0013DA8AA7|nr:aspartyl-phosphate phosphatase Spo0E family protein [Oceanobacillus halotolerans]
MGNAGLLQKIEDCRKEMIMLSSSYEMTSEIVVQSSKKLDALINEYQNNTDR